MMKKNIFILILFLLSLTGVAQQSSVDVITLKNGNVVRGKIIEQTGTLVKVYTTNKSMVEFKPDEIDKITKETSSTPEAGLTIDQEPTTQGNMIIGGSGSFYWRKSSGTNGSLIGMYLEPTAAWFVVDYLAVGAGISTGLYFNDGETSYTLGIGPLVKYYSDFGLVFSAQATYEYSHYPSTKTSWFALKPGIGYAIFLNQKVSLEPTLTYQFSSEKNNSSTQKTNRIGIDIGLTIFL
jgi:hypothetical protein